MLSRGHIQRMSAEELKACDNTSPEVRLLRPAERRRQGIGRDLQDRHATRR